MIIENFLVQKPTDGTSYRILDPIGFPAVEANNFLQHLDICGRSPYTLHSYAVGLADFLAWLRSMEISISEVTRNVIGRYIADFSDGPQRGISNNARKRAKRKPRTINHRVSVLASYFAFLIRENEEAGVGPWCQRPNPVSGELTARRHGVTGRDAPARGRASEFRRRVPRDIPAQVDATSALKLIETAHSWRDKSILTLLFRTGQRIGNWNDGGGHGILGMSISDVDQSRSMITVRLKGARDEHRVPVTEDFWPTFRRYINEERSDAGDSTALWVALRRGGGEPLNYAAFEASLRYISRKAGVRVHAHMFRHLLAQTVLQVTGNLKAAQDLLGHAHISTTADLYMHVDQAAMVQAVAAVRVSLDSQGSSTQLPTNTTPPSYAFPYDSITIEELDGAIAATLLRTGEAV